MGIKINISGSEFDNVEILNNAQIKGNSEVDLKIKNSKLKNKTKVGNNIKAKDGKINAEISNSEIDHSELLNDIEIEGKIDFKDENVKYNKSKVLNEKKVSKEESVVYNHKGENDFKKNIKVEKMPEETPIMKAHKELEIAKQKGDNTLILKTMEKLIDIQREEQAKKYQEKAQEFIKKQKELLIKNDQEQINKFNQQKEQYYNKMRIDELTYKINKLMIQQKLKPSQETQLEINKLKNKLNEMQKEEMQK